MRSEDIISRSHITLCTNSTTIYISSDIDKNIINYAYDECFSTEMMEKWIKTTEFIPKIEALYIKNYGTAI